VLPDTVPSDGIEHVASIETLRRTLSKTLTYVSLNGHAFVLVRVFLMSISSTNLGATAPGRPKDLSRMKIPKMPRFWPHRDECRTSSIYGHSLRTSRLNSKR
jgi:hypothetical protein